MFNPKIPFNITDIFSKRAVSKIKKITLRTGAAAVAAVFLSTSFPSVTFAVQDTDTKQSSTAKTDNTEDTEDTNTDSDSDSDTSDSDSDSESTKSKTDNTKKEQPKNPERKQGEKPILGEGETAILIDSASGRVLYESESGKRMYPASTTKVMTALLTIEAIERGEYSLDTQVEVTADMLEGLDPDGTNMALKAGEILSIDSLLKGLMIPSGNDAAAALAEFIGKGSANFIDMMNKRASEIGCTDTHFVNPSGLHHDDHYTTAADMAKIAQTAMKLDKFRNIVDIAHIKIKPTNKTEKERYYINTNGLLSTMRYGGYYFKDANGIKTGHTSNAGYCLVSSAKRDGLEFIGVVFGGKEVSDSHKDSIEMLEWGFETYSYLRVLSKDDMPCEIKVKLAKSTDAVTLSVAENVNVIVPKGTNVSDLEIRPNIPEHISAPVEAGQEVGTISVLQNGTEIGNGKLIATRAVERSFFWPIMALGDMLWNNIITRTLIILLGLGIILFALAFIRGMYINIKRAKRKQKHRRQRR